MENLSMALRAMFSQMSGDDILKEAGFVPFLYKTEMNISAKGN